MKLLLLLPLLLFTLIAQDTYNQGKIDMHGGKEDSYNNFKSYKNEGARSFSMDMSKFLDRNTTKNSK